MSFTFFFNFFLFHVKFHNMLHTGQNALMNEALAQCELLTALEIWGSNIFTAQVRWGDQTLRCHQMPEHSRKDLQGSTSAGKSLQENQLFLIILLHFESDSYKFDFNLSFLMCKRPGNGFVCLVVMCQTPSKLLHGEIIIGPIVSFASVSLALQHSPATWGQINAPQDGVHFSSLLNAAIFFPVWGLRGECDVHLTCVLFITLISMKCCWSASPERKGSLKSLWLLNVHLVL